MDGTSTSDLDGTLCTVLDGTSTDLDAVHPRSGLKAANSRGLVPLVLALLAPLRPGNPRLIGDLSVCLTPLLAYEALGRPHRLGMVRLCLGLLRLCLPQPDFFLAQVDFFVALTARCPDESV